MKKYLIIGGLSFALGAGTLLYSGTADDIQLVTDAFVSRNQQTMTIDAELASEKIQRVKLQTELARMEFELDKREIELKLEALNEVENAQKLALEEERAANKEWAWWVSFAKIFWLLVIAVALPLAALSLLVVKAFVVVIKGEGYDQAE